MNKEIKIAIVVGAIMITACILAVLVYNSNQNKITEINLNVYKLNTEGKDLSEYSESEIKQMHLKYQKCSISTEDLVKVNREYNKMTKVGDSNKVPGYSIVGYYKIVDADGNYIAFDNAGGFFDNRKEALFTFNSDIYKIVIDACGK